MGENDYHAEFEFEGRRCIRRSHNFWGTDLLENPGEQVDAV